MLQTILTELQTIKEHLSHHDRKRGRVASAWEEAVLAQHQHHSKYPRRPRAAAATATSTDDPPSEPFTSSSSSTPAPPGSGSHAHPPVERERGRFPPNMAYLTEEEELIARCQNQHSASFVLELTRDGGFPTFVCINPLFTKNFGFSPSDLVNYGLGIIFPSSTLQLLKRALLENSTPRQPGASSISSSFHINFYNSAFKETATVCTITLWYDGLGLPKYTLFNIIPLPSAPPTWSAASTPQLGYQHLPHYHATPNFARLPLGRSPPDLDELLDLDAFFATDESHVL
jgi:hypothetical protein